MRFIYGTCCVCEPTWAAHSGWGHTRRRLFSSKYGWGEGAASRERILTPGRTPSLLPPSSVHTKRKIHVTVSGLTHPFKKPSTFQKSSTCIPASCGRWARCACLFCDWASHRTWVCRRFPCRPVAGRSRSQTATSLSCCGKTGKKNTQSKYCNNTLEGRWPSG